MDPGNSPVFVYVIKSDQHWRFYVGLGLDVEGRVREHNAGKTRSTKPYRPWKLVTWFERETLSEARALEKWLKSGVGKEYIKRHWANNFEKDND